MKTSRREIYRRAHVSRIPARREHRALPRRSGCLAVNNTADFQNHPAISHPAYRRGLTRRRGARTLLISRVIYCIKQMSDVTPVFQGNASRDYVIGLRRLAAAAGIEFSREIPWKGAAGAKSRTLTRYALREIHF